MLVLVIGNDHGNGNDHSRDDKENLNGVGQGVNGIKNHPVIDIACRATDVMIQADSNGRQSSQTMNNREVGLH
jgi:hypothetical protein